MKNGPSLRFPFFLVYLLTFSPFARSAVQPAYEFESYITSMWDSVDNTPPVLTLLRTIESYKKTQASAIEQSPFSTSTGFNINDALPATPTNTGGQDSFAYAFQNSLTYQLRNSLQLAWTASGNITRYDNYTDIAGESNTGRNLTLGVQVSFDLLNLGIRNPIELQAQVSASQADQQTASNMSQLLQTYISIYSALTDLYTNVCKLRELEKSMQIVNKMTEAAHLKAEVKLYSQKDLLNIVNLDSTILVQKTTQEQLVQTYRQGLLAYGEKFAVEAWKRTQMVTLCTPYLQSVEKLETFDIPQTSQKLPAYKAAKAAEVAADYQVNLARANNRPSLKPSAQAGFVRNGDGPVVNPIGNQPNWGVGILFSWTVPQEKGEYALESAVLAKAAADKQLNSTYLGNVSQLETLVAQYETQRAVLSALRENVDNARKLVHTLELGFSVGTVDSLNYSNAKVSEVTALQSLLDGWGTLRKTLYQIRENLVMAH